MIDAKELQIGNWISFSGANRKIAGIFGTPGEFMMLDTYWPSVGYKESTLSFRVEYAQPIPITIDVLKNNGFDLNGISEDLVPVDDRDFSDDTYVWATGNSLDDTYTQVCLYLDYRNDDWIASVDTPSIGMESIRLKYIHELQNLLTLMRIEKEIIL